MTTTIEGPADIVRMGRAFCTAKILLTALELGLFTELADGPATEAELCEKLGLRPRAVGHFLDALVIMGLLERAGGRYGNGRVAADFLVRGGKTYIGGFLERVNLVLYPAWGQLAEALRSGKPQTDGALDTVLSDPARLRSYLGMMDALSGPLAAEIAKAFDWGVAGTVTDIGGARGNMAGNIALAHPHLQVAVFDLPPMEAPFREHMTALGVAGRARFHGGDFFTDPLPPADVLMIGHVLHNWSPEERRALVRKAFDAVAPGGALLVYDRMVDQDSTDPENLLVSLDMLLTTSGGSEYTVGECASYLTEAGFTVASTASIGHHDTLVIARKAP